MKKIGLLTCGGDCAGLNAAIRAVTLKATEKYGWEVYGIRQGTQGLLKRPVDAIKLNKTVCNGGVLRQGGTLLGSTTKMPAGSKEGLENADALIEGYHLLGLEALIGIAGDGGQMILRKFAMQGRLNLITIPKTIDDDVGLTDHSIGFMTAVGVATEALDRLHPTAASHDRIMVLEVMGRDAGHIALHAGIAGGADIILIPEVPYTLGALAEKVKSLHREGNGSALIIVSEAVSTESGEKLMISDSTGKSRYGGIAHYLADQLNALTAIETRFTVLGHVQRGAPPLFQDRILASAFGAHAVDLVAQGKFDRMVAWQNKVVTDVPIQEALTGYQAVNVNGTLMKTARDLGIFFGDEKL